MPVRRAAASTTLRSRGLGPAQRRRCGIRPRSMTSRTVTSWSVVAFCCTTDSTRAMSRGAQSL